ncbi:hypothetical protein L211DRAFT_782109, partial [Terfezia boudieri ATCC MYA-4762]
NPAYAPSYGIRDPYRAGSQGLTPDQEAFNVVMSKYRIVVECGFANVINQENGSALNRAFASFN